MSGPDCLERLRQNTPDLERLSATSADVSSVSEEVVLRRPYKSGSTAIKRRPGRRLSRSKVQLFCCLVFGT